VSKPCIPLVDRITVPHANVAPRTDGNQIVDGCLAALGLGHIVAALKVKHIHLVLAPRNLALAFKYLSGLGDPNLFT